MSLLKLVTNMAAGYVLGKIAAHLLVTLDAHRGMAKLEAFLEEESAAS